MATYTKGYQQQAWIAEESTYGTYPGTTTTDSFVAADAVPMLTAKLSAKQEFKDRDTDRDNTLTLKTRTPLRKEGEWNIKLFLDTAASAAAAPDWYVPVKNLFGSAAASGSYYVFKPTTDPNGSFSTLIGDAGGNNKTNLAVGCISESLKISANGGDIVTMELSGKCKEVYEAGRTTVPGGATGAATSITTADSSVYWGDALVSVGSLGGERLKLSAIANSTQIITVERGWGSVASGTIASGTTLIPWMPSSQTLAATAPKTGISGTISVGGNSYSFKSFEFEAVANKTLINDHYGTSAADGVVCTKKREFKITFDGRLERDLYKVLTGGGRHQEQLAVQVDMGTASPFFRINMPTCEIVDNPQEDIPERDEGTTKITLRALHATSGSEITFAQR